MIMYPFAWDLLCVYLFADLAPATLDWCRPTVSSMRDLLCLCRLFVFGWSRSVATENPANTSSISTATLSPWCWSTASSDVLLPFFPASRTRAHGQRTWTGSPSMAPSSSSSSSASSWLSAHGPAILAPQTHFFQALTHRHQVSMHCKLCTPCYYACILLSYI